MLTRRATAPRHETPNAVMTTLASPSLGTTDLAVWEVAMAAGQQGPWHATDTEQVWLVLDGELRIEGDAPTVVAAGETLRVAPDARRQVTASADTRAVVATLAGCRVTTPDGGARPLPWAA